MTSAQDGPRSRRKELVTLSVVAGSAISLAGTWIGIAAADSSRTQSSNASVPVTLPVTRAAAAAEPVQGTTAPSATGTNGGSTQAPTRTLLVPVPSQQQVAPVRPVRRSRAS